MSEKGEPEGYNISVRYSMYSPSQHLSSLQYVQSVTTSQFATVCTVRHNITVRYSMYSPSQHLSSLQYVQYATTSQFQLKSHNCDTSYVMPPASLAQLPSTCYVGKSYQPSLQKNLSTNVSVQYISSLPFLLF